MLVKGELFLLNRYDVRIYTAILYPKKLEAVKVLTIFNVISNFTSNDQIGGSRQKSWEVKTKGDFFLL